ncbi:MAG: hypothetical protein JNK87_11780 [Bryobacterales bacterium]|nr:hypothetical protein [Bryobacterales bacterium]
MNRTVLFVTVFLLSADLLRAQPGTVTTIAGQFPLGDGGPAADAAFYAPGALARDSKGNVYVLETNRLRRIAPDGVVATYAGTGLDSGPIGDGGPANRANLSTRSWGQVAVDANDNLYIADWGNNRIRKITPDGVIMTIAGTGESAFSGDGGPATEARISRPLRLALGHDGSVFFIDGNNYRVRRIRPDGIIETVAGVATQGPTSPEGTLATKAQFEFIQGVAVDAEGRVLVADPTRVFAIAGDGTLVLVAGGGTLTMDGIAATELTTGINWIGPDGKGGMWFSDYSTIRRIPAGGTVETVLGGGRRMGSSLAPGERVPARSLLLRVAQPPLWISDEEFLFSDIASHLLYRYGRDGMVERYAGVSLDAGANGPSQFARVTAPNEVLTEPDGIIHLMEELALRYIEPAGTVRTRWADRGMLNGMALTPSGDLVVSHPSNDVGLTNRQTNAVRLIAGANAPAAFSGDGGPAVEARLNGPQGIAVDSAGNVFIADSNNHRIRKVDTDGTITTFAGTGVAGFAGDRGPATNAQLSFPRGIAFAPDGTLYIADTSNRRIRTVGPDGVILTYLEPTDFFGGGWPNRMAFAPDGSLIVTDTAHRIHRVSRARAIQVIGGTGVAGFSGDGGPSTAAAFNNPGGVSVDGNGNIYIADKGNNRIRMIRGISTVRADPRSFVFAYALGAPAVSQTLTLISGDDDATQYRVTTNVPWLVVTPSSGELTPPSVLLRVTASPAGLGRGAYQGRITILNVDKGDSYEVPVSMIISGTPQQLRLDRSGLTFATMANGATLTQTLRVLNTGTGAMPWTALASTTSGGTWLRVTPGSG